MKEKKQIEETKSAPKRKRRAPMKAPVKKVEPEKAPVKKVEEKKPEPWFPGKQFN